VETHCSKCHNPDKKKGDLDLTSYAGVMKGGGSGSVVMSGNPDASKLFRVLKHLEDPTMPPNKPPLAEKDLEVFRKWIVDGLLETAGGKAVPVAQPAVDLALKVSTEGKPDGPPAMPSGLPTQALVHTDRPGSVLSVSCSPWAPVVALTGQKQVLLYHADSLERLGVLGFTNGEPCVVRFSRSGRLLLAGGGRGGKSGRVVLWDVATGKPMTVLGEEYDVVLGADISPDQTRVALGGPGRLLKIHATATGEVEHKIKKHTDWVTAVAFSPNGQMLASADRNGGIHVWDPENGQEILALAGHPACVHGLAWRGDSKVLISCGEDGTVKTWETESGKLVKSWVAHEGGVLAVACAHDGEIASAGRNGKVRTWDADGGKHKSFTLEDDFAVSVAFTSDGARLVAGTFAGKAPVWSLKEAKSVGEMDANPPLPGKLAKGVAQASSSR
jgi:WD40 repeat protein